MALLEAVNGSKYHILCRLDQIFILPDINKSPGHDVRSGNKLAGTAFQSQDHNNNTILGQALSIFEDDVADVPDAQSVYQDRTSLYMINDLAAFRCQLDHVSGIRHDDIGLRYSDGKRNFPLCKAVTDLAVGSREEAASVLKELLQGRGPKAMRDMVALNAGLAIFLVEQGATLDECMAKGRAAVEQAAGRGSVHA